MPMQANSREVTLVRCNKTTMNVTGTSQSVLQYLKAGHFVFAICHHNGNELQACQDFTFFVIKHNQQQAG